MGYTLARITETFSNKDNHDWLGSSHGVDAADSITLDAADLLAAYPDGEVPAGIEVSLGDSTRYEIGHAGTKPGFLLHGLKVATGYNPVGALLWHGEIVVAKLPAAPAAGYAAAHPLIRFV